MGHPVFLNKGHLLTYTRIFLGREKTKGFFVYCIFQQLKSTNNILQVQFYCLCRKFWGMLKKVGIFFGIKYEPLSDPPTSFPPPLPPSPSLKKLSVAPGPQGYGFHVSLVWKRLINTIL